MNITKYEHACLVVEEQGKQLLIDPGKFAESLPDLPNLVAIIVTHAHFDHLDSEKVAGLSKKYKAPIFTTNEAKNELPGVDVTTPELGKEFQVGPFSLEFFGEQHAPIHHSLDTGQNIGVMVNNTLYYPGDSFELPGKPVNILAAPVSGPWMKTGEAIDFITQAKPHVIIPVHDALHSDVGHMVSDNFLQETAKKINATYQRLSPSETLSV